MGTKRYLRPKFIAVRVPTQTLLGSLALELFAFNYHKSRDNVTVTRSCPLFQKCYKLVILRSDSPCKRACQIWSP